VGVVGELDAAGLAAPARVHLRLDDTVHPAAAKQRACGGVSATSPLGTATPNSRASALAGIRGSSRGTRSQISVIGLRLATDGSSGQAERLEGQRAEQRCVTCFTEDHVGDTDCSRQNLNRAPPLRRTIVAPFARRKRLTLE